ncbi:unnamed protein product [Rhizophagus irregularis]|nr:unnamed protein product [Rhizophagus irregularis]CAB4429137.1 unnamed protein product [Rhizophagus irregularis]
MLLVKLTTLGSGCAFSIKLQTRDQANRNYDPIFDNDDNLTSICKWKVIKNIYVGEIFSITRIVSLLTSEKENFFLYWKARLNVSPKLCYPINK